MKKHCITIKLADLIVQLEFDNSKWCDVFSRKWEDFIIEEKAKYKIVFITNRPKLDPIAISQNSTELIISCHPDYLKKYIFRTLNYGIKKVISQWLFKKKRYLIHASAIKINNHEAILFSGPTYSGKSTVLGLLSDYKPIADDTIFIMKKNDYVICYTTPFHEKLHLKKKPEKLRVSDLFFLKKNTSNYIKSIPDEERIRKIMQIFVLWYPLNNKNLFNELLITAKAISPSLPMNYLHFTKSKRLQRFFNNYCS